MTERENMRFVWDHKTPEWVPMINIASQLLIIPEINDRPLFEAGKDWFGLEWGLGENKGLMTHVVPGQKLICNISDWRKDYSFPSCKDLNWEMISNRTKAMWQKKDELMGYVVMLMGGFEKINAAMGFEDGLCAIYEDTDAYIDFINAYADYRIEQFNYIDKYMDPDFYMLHDDWGSQNNIFINPKLWRKIFKPAEKRMVDHVHSLGKKYMHHSCGKIDQIIGDMVEIGIDSWHSVQPVNDLVNIKRTYGDQLIFAGGVDPQVTDVEGVTEEEIRKEVRRAIDVLAPNGGYLCSSAVMYSTIPGVDVIIEDEGRKYGRSFYK